MLYLTIIPAYFITNPQQKHRKIIKDFHYFKIELIDLCNFFYIRNIFLYNQINFIISFLLFHFL